MPSTLRRHGWLRDYDITEGPMSIVYAWSRRNVDSFSHYHGPTRGFSDIVLVEPQDW